MKKVLFSCQIIVLITCQLHAQNVGIGTTLPQAKLHIKGNADTSQLIIEANSTQSNSRPLIRLRNAVGADLMHIHSDHLTNTFIGLDAGRVNNAPGGGVGNSFFGSSAGYSNTTGFSNAAIGIKALYNNADRNNLVAIGDSALYNNGIGAVNSTEGSRNTAIGSKTLYLNTTGYYNTANGYRALYSNTTGSRNTACGLEALFANNIGDYNTAHGMYALNKNTIGNNNTANGLSALYNNTKGNYNTASGAYALFSNVAGSFSTAVGYNAMLYANSNPLAIYSDNVAVGYEALRGSTDASANSGINNTAVGMQTLLNNSTGDGNTANGFLALTHNTTGNYNTAIGREALSGNTAGSEATAVGFHAMFYANNQTIPFKNYNVAVGTEALMGSGNPANNLGNDNTAVGYQSLYSNSQGSYNIAIGEGALYNSTTGYFNVALGYNALNANTIGSRNIALGNQSNVDLSNSNGNTIVGASAHVSGSNDIAIGYNSFTNVNNLALLGSTTTTQCGGYANWSNFSDGRFKTNVDEDVKGLDFIMRLRPVTYHMDVRAIYNLWGISPYAKHDEDAKEGNDKLSASMKTEMDYAISNKEAIRMSGFIAQEVEKAAQQSGYDFDGVIKPVHDKDHYRLAYGEFVVPLVKAMQEQQQMIVELRKENNELKVRFEKLEKLMMNK